MIPPFLQIVFAIGGASFAWRAYSSLYERQRAASQPFDPVTHEWWRILSKAVGVGLLSFVLVVIAAGVQPALPSPRWLAILLLSVLAVSLIVALVGAGALWRRAAR
jgi:threonine/homoserine/homoserine lactone efflux protein